MGGGSAVCEFPVTTAAFPATTAAVAALVRGGSVRGADRTESGSGGPLGGVCVGMASDLGVDGASISVETARSDERATAGTSNPVASLLEELQFDLGVGPCFDAVSTGAPVLVEDIRAARETRWPALTPALAEQGVRALWAVPLRLGAHTVGVTEVYRDSAGLPDVVERAALLGAADLAVVAVLELSGAPSRSDATTRPDTIGPPPVHGHEHDRPGDEVGVETADLLIMSTPGSRATIHQATGMVVGQLGMTTVAALARLRAYAYAQERSLGDVCADVVARRLHLDPH